MSEKPELMSRAKSFGGWTEFYRHRSEATGGEMRFSVYRPPQAESRKVPVLTFLSGLTCTEENFMAKSGAQAHASRLGLMIVAPDTSPRGTGFTGATESWDFGEGAGFYVNATEKPWDGRFRMYDYVTRELPALVRAHFPAMDREGICGHSMGGHGALVAALRQPGRYLSVSAFAPISSPTRCPWGRKAFERYLGRDESRWRDYDASLLMAAAKKTFPVLVDQGADDKFLAEQLRPETLREAAEASGFPLTLRIQSGYDHSYYFVASFMEDHLKFHGEALNRF